MTKYISIVLGFIIVIYPFAVYWGVSALGVGSVALFLACLFIFRLFCPTTFYGVAKHAKAVRWMAGIGFLLAILSWLMHDPQWFKYYPVAVNIIFFAVFLVSLIHPPSIIERFARLKEPSLAASGVRYTKTVTQVWCAFFLLNGSVALYTVVATDFKSWALYNGLISYFLIGLLMAVEFCFRHFYRKRM
jgi:uncharacterized membrane protein